MTPLDTLKQLRAPLPTPLGGDRLGGLLNAVAWIHRAEGYGLLAKPTGGNCRQPQTGILISRDILCRVDGPNLLLFDVLIDAEGKATPTWGSKKPLQDLTRWVAPVDASVALPPPPDPPRPDRPYPGDHLGTQIGDYLFADYAAAGQAPNPGMGVWMIRVAWDIANPPYLTPAQSLEKHRESWRRILGLA